MKTKNKGSFWIPFLLFSLLYILYTFVVASQGYLILDVMIILGGMIGLYISLEFIFPNKKSFTVPIVLFSIAAFCSLVFSSPGALPILMITLSLKAIESFLVFSFVFWIYKKIREKLIKNTLKNARKKQ